MSCLHPALFKSMCVTCGVIVKSTENYVGNTSLTMHGGAALQVSSREAEAIQANKLTNLRDLRKLALVLDLDHTLLHAVQIDGPMPQGNPISKDFPEEVFHLPIEEVVNNSVKHLVMKKRPNLDWFLKEAHEICQMTIYTAGTRRYAEAVAKIIDPDHKYFSNRIVSRSDNPNVKADAHDKSLERIFLRDSSMAIIIDDREDVWRANSDSQHLLLVRPYIYFTPKNTHNNTVVEANNSSGPTGALGTSPVGPREAISPVIALSGSPGKILKTVVQHSSEFSESDDQLPRCLEIVKDLHSRYYAGKVKSNLPSSSSSSSSSSGVASDSVSFGNVRSLLTSAKTSVLAGCTVTFSGIIPTNDPNPQNHVLYKLAESLGANVSLDLLPRTTHLIALNVSTSKAVECMQNRRHNLWILHPDWLIYCRWSLARVLEVTFMLNALEPGEAFPVIELNETPLTPTFSRRPEKANGRLNSFDASASTVGSASRGGSLKRSLNDDSSSRAEVMKRVRHEVDLNDSYDFSVDDGAEERSEAVLYDGDEQPYFSVPVRHHAVPVESSDEDDRVESDREDDDYSDFESIVLSAARRSAEESSD